MQEHRFSPRTAKAVVIANMVGTGVFTSLGFQLMDIRSGFVLMMLWLVGGLTALCGALCYAELGAALPRSGGEYHFLYQIYHPAAGYVSGWVSATIGFAAPTALAAITFGSYLGSVFSGLSKTWLACLLVLALSTVHAGTRRSSGGVQRAFTGLKLLLITGFCVLAWLAVQEPQTVRLLPGQGDARLITSSAFAVSLIYVNYAYTGWNAATYLTSELADPARNLSRVLVAGTLVVTGLYLALNWTFLHVAPMDAMVGRIEIGYVAAIHAFGNRGGDAMGVVLAALLISTVSAMVLAGPRVLQVIGEDFAAFRLLARTNRHGVPHVAIALQVGAGARCSSSPHRSSGSSCSPASRSGSTPSFRCSGCSCCAGGVRTWPGPTARRCIRCPRWSTWASPAGRWATSSLQRPAEALMGTASSPAATPPTS